MERPNLLRALADGLLPRRRRGTTRVTTADEMRRKMVEDIVERNAVQDERIRRAFERTPRHRFIPDVDLETAYSNQSVDTHWEGDTPVSCAPSPKSWRSCSTTWTSRPEATCWRSER